MTPLPRFLVAAAFVAFGSCASAAVELAEGPGADWCAGPRAASNHAPMQPAAATPPQTVETPASAETLPDGGAAAKSSGCQSLALR